MMQKIHQTLHLGNDTAPRTKPPRSTTARTNSSVARLTMPVVPSQMRRVLRSASLCAIFLMLLAQNAIELAITPINAPSALETLAAKAQRMRRNSQRTQRRAQSAAQSATSLTSSAQDVAKLAITQTGALSHIRTTAAKAQLPRNPQEHHLSMLPVAPLSPFPSSHL